MKELSLGVGDVVALGGSTWKVERELTLHGRASAWLVRHARHKRWLWGGGDDPAWSELLERAFDRPRQTLPRLLAIDEREGRKLALLEHNRPETRPFTNEAWRALPREMAIDALQRLTLAIGTLHDAGLCIGGLERDQLLWDEANGSLYIGALLRPRAFTTAIEDVWRDIKLVGELLYENITQTTYPGGHKMAAILQNADKSPENHATWQPGLPQVLAGCVTPYGELALTSAHGLWVALENLRVEIERPPNLTIGARSTVGSYIFRRNNQDACGAVQMKTICGSRLTTFGFFCVADGIGGIKDGERASSLAVTAGCEAFGRACAHRGGEMILEHPSPTARGIARVVSQQLALEGEFDPGGNRGGTTFSGLVIAGRRAGIGHVGDSRIYLCRDGELLQLTRDHNLSVIMEELGLMEGVSEKKRKAHERTISRFMTTGNELDDGRIDSFTVAAADALDVDIEALLTDGLPLSRGDLFLLTSDGAHGELPDKELLEILSQHTDPQAVCDAIVSRVVSRIGHDNITALAVRVD